MDAASLPSQTNVQTAPISCDVSVGDYCSTHSCSTTLDATFADGSLCPLVAMNCNGYVLIHATTSDGESDWWYRNGALVAFEPSTIAGQTCAAGPTTFDRPLCDFSLAVPLDVCN